MGRPRVLKSVQRGFWRGIAQGLFAEEAGRRVGVNRSTGVRWFREAGGMSPISLVEPPVKGRYLSLAEREEIAVGIAAGETPAAIAVRIGRHRTTIGREIANNGVARWPAGYRAGAAQAKAEAAARRPKTGKLAASPRLAAAVQDGLTQRWSPEQISRRLVEDHPDDGEMRVSYETIYQALYVQGRGGLRRELTACLRTGRALRRPSRQPAARRTRITDMVMISERPAEVADRAVPGHWEGDLILGSANGSAIGTLVERSTRFVMLLHLPQGHGALAVQEAMCAAMAELPQTLRRTLTWDQGGEMRNHLAIADATGLQIYFCDPHSPWQRGSNENTNGLLRQYFPKGTDLSVFPADYLDYVAMQLNNRPRKRHGYKTPAEVLDQLLSDTPNHHGVA